MQLADAVVFANFSEGADGDLAASAQAVEQSTFAGGGGAGGSVVQKFQVVAGCGLAFADFDAQRSLPGGWAHGFGGDDLLNQFGPAQALQSRGGQDDGIVFTLFELAQARVDVAAQGMNVEIGADGLKLRPPAQTGRPHARAAGKVFDLRIESRAEGIARVLSFRDGSDFESWRNLSGQVFQRMHGEIDPAGGESFFDLFRENSFAQSALCANLAEGNVGDLVAGGVDDFNFYFMAARTKKRGDEVSLAEGKLGAAGADAEFRHHRPDPTPLSDASLPDLSSFPSCGTFPLSCRLNNRRTTSITVVASASRAAVFRVVIGVCMTLLMMPRVRASTALSCSGVNGPMRPRTRSISAWRMVSK